MKKKKVLIASYNLTENTSTCPAEEMKRIINDRTFLSEITSPEYNDSLGHQEFNDRCFTIDKSRAVVRLTNLTVDNKIVNLETGEEIKADYVYNENHFIRLNVYADVEIINEDLARECNIDLDNITFVSRMIVLKKSPEIEVIKDIITWDVGNVSEEKRLLKKDIAK